MSKFAIQNIKYRPTINFRAGPGDGFAYTMSNAVLNWWSLESVNIEPTDAATYRSEDHVDARSKIPLIYASNAARSHVSSDVPSRKITKSSIKFGNTGQIAQTSTNAVSFANTSISSGDDPFSISFWAKKVGGDASSKIIIANSSPSGYTSRREYTVAFALGTQPILEVYGNQDLSESISIKAQHASSLLSSSEWKHYVFSYSGKPIFNGSTMASSGLKIYVNGEVQTSNLAQQLEDDYSGMRTNPLNVFTIGDVGGGGNILLSDLIVFNKEIDSDSVKALYYSKDGSFIRTRNYLKKGSKVSSPEGSEIDGFREGVSIRNGEDLSTSIRMKIHSTLDFVRAHSGSAVSVDSPFDDANIPFYVAQDSGSYKGVLDSTRGHSGYSSVLLHEVEKRDFGIFNRHQDGTPFNDTLFDTPQKVLEDVRTIAGDPDDRHLRVYIGETPNELYNSTDVYDKEARVDIFERSIDLRSIIPDLRDGERDFTRRSRRLTRSGSMTIPARTRGFSGECNCIGITDVRFNDNRESSIPFYEVYREGDMHFTSSAVKDGYMHAGRGTIETILSQSSGPRHIDTSYSRRSEPYGVYAQSTVDTFYGLPGADKLQGRTFTARYRVSSADKPFRDESKETFVEEKFNSSNFNFDAGVGASAQLVYGIGANLSNLDTITITSTDQTTKSYRISSGGGLSSGMVVGNKIVVVLGANNSATAAQIVAAINTSNGHNAGTPNSKIILEQAAINDDEGTITFTQAVGGTAGNTAVTKNQSGDFTVTNFSGGKQSDNKDFVDTLKKMYMTGSSIHEGPQTGYTISTRGIQGDTGQYKTDSIVFVGMKRN